MWEWYTQVVKKNKAFWVNLLNPGGFPSADDSQFASHFPWPPPFVFTYSSVRKLVKLSAVQFMLNNHTVSGFSFFLSSFQPPTHTSQHIKGCSHWGPGAVLQTSGSGSGHTARLLSSELLSGLRMTWVVLESPTTIHIGDKFVVGKTIVTDTDPEGMIMEPLVWKGSVILKLLTCILPLTHVFTFLTCFLFFTRASTFHFWVLTISPTWQTCGVGLPSTQHLGVSSWWI